MIAFSGKHLLSCQRAYALIVPEMSGERPEYAKFGFAPRLADYLLGVHGWDKSRRTDDEISAMVQALFDPMIDVWGCRLIEAQHRVVHDVAWVLDLADLHPYYDGPATDDEYVIREWIERHLRDLSIKHILLDALVQYDGDLDAPGLLAQIHRQLDEEG
jgi:hypothetical protein